MSHHPILNSLRGLGVTPTPAIAPLDPVEEPVERYRRYMLVERGLTRPRVYIEAIRPFVASSNGSERLELRVGLKAEPEPRILAGEFVRLFVCC